MPGDSPSDFYRSAWIVYLILAIIGLLGLGHHHGEIGLDLFIDRADWWLDGLLGIAAGLALVGAWHGSKAWFPAMRDLESWMCRAIGPLSPSEVFALALISGFSEELLFRGAIQSAWGWAWSLGIFTLLHTGPSRTFLYWTFFALVAGGSFSFLTDWRGNLLPAIVAHVVVNGLNLSLLKTKSQAEGVFDR